MRRIVGVSREHIDYIDAAGEERFIDLDECARNWGRGRNAAVGSDRYRAQLQRASLCGTHAVSASAELSTNRLGSSS